MSGKPGEIRIGDQVWTAPETAGVDEAAEGVESFTVNTAVIMSERCPRCGKVKVGNWVSSKDDEPLPQPDPPPEHTQEECDHAVVDAVHDL